MLLSSILAHVERKLSVPDERARAYQAFLHAIDAWGLLRGLPCDASETLRVGMPFCGQLGEAPLLLPFLADRLLDTSASDGTCAKYLDIMGSDVLAEPEAFWWPAWREWAGHKFGGRVRLDLRRQDLSAEPLPRAGLILAIHPQVLEAIAHCSGPRQAASDPGVTVEVKSAGPWHSILANVLRACQPDTMCIFATFYLSEARAAEAILRGLGRTAEIRENPYYAGVPADRQDTHLRFAVIASR